MANYNAIDDDTIEDIISEIAVGSTLKGACERAGFHYGNISERIRKSERLAALHARAREEYVHFQVQRMHDIANDEEDVQRAKLKVDCIKWEAARVLPKQFGDKVTQELVGPDGGPVQVQTITRKILDPA